MELVPISPVDGRPLARPSHTLADLDRMLARAVAARAAWREVSLAERVARLTKMVDAVVADSDAIATAITLEMGRPRRYTPGEVRGFEERARTMLRLAPDALADLELPPKTGFTRFLRREPLGTVLVLAAWNYPWLVAVNSVVPALAAGNAVVLKHSPQTPSCPEQLERAMAAAGLPDGLFQVARLSHADCAVAVADPRVDAVAFTGSVEGGRAVHAAAAGRFKPVGLELGGCDPAYVRPDAALEPTVDNLVDGAFFNSGQSCCAVERIYVHRDLFRPFVDAFVALVEQYRLGDPRNPETTLGPVVHVPAAERIRRTVAAAVAAGARPLIDPGRFALASPGTPWVAPQVLVDVDHSMAVMTEETFGPVVGIMPVASDEEAVERMNDSRYGLTASVWTRDLDTAIRLGERVQTGTFFLNRCDALDPELAWVGVKDSGRGCTLSRVGYEQLTRPKSFHLRHHA